jgi:hypothetical protein
MAERTIVMVRMDPRNGVSSSLSDLRLIYCASGRNGPYLPAFSLHRTTMRLEIGQICPRFPTWLVTIAQVRQAASVMMTKLPG